MARRYVLLIILALISVGCTSPTPQAGPPTSLPATAAPTISPTTPSSPTSAPATDTSAPPTATTAPATSAPSVTAPPSGGAATYVSQNLGIRFDYLPNQGGETVGVMESGNKVYLYAGNAAPTTGQYVQVYNKPANQSLADAIKAQVLQGYSAQDCIVTPVSDPNKGANEPATYTYAQITLPGSPSDPPETVQARAGKCPQPYAAVGGLAYFLADSAHPDKFLFFSIGQYAIMASATQTWQMTIQFTGGSTGGGPTTVYLDDRSTGESLIESYVNALNRMEYDRAYSYWETGSSVQPYNQFKQGYANTQSIALTVGPSGPGAAAGNLYWSVPVVMIATTTGGQTQTFQGCYVTHLPQPANFSAPPVPSMAIQQATVTQVANGSNPATLLASACQGLPGGPAVTPTPYAANDISASRYLDDRSDGVQVLRSLFNSINRHEYARAYGYWEPGAVGLAPFPQFEQGYQNTASVQLTTGTMTSDAGAGQFYYKVPVTLVSQTTGGQTQTFVGCYTLHLSNPGIQDTPPFQPLAIRSATVQQVANNANTTALMSQACQ